MEEHRGPREGRINQSPDALDEAKQEWRLNEAEDEKNHNRLFRGPFGCGSMWLVFLSGLHV
jgi:hypothetical protein